MFYALQGSTKDGRGRVKTNKPTGKGTRAVGDKNEAKQKKAIDEIKKAKLGACPL